MRGEALPVRGRFLPSERALRGVDRWEGNELAVGTIAAITSRREYERTMVRACVAWSALVSVPSLLKVARGSRWRAVALEASLK